MGGEGIIIWVLLGAIALIFLIGFTINIIAWAKDLRRELRHINMEIARNTGSERKRWKRRKRRFLLSLIPFVRFK